jgi:hypothetical protein
LKDHERQECTVTVWEQVWRDFLEVQKLECKPIAKDATEETGQSESESLPLLGKNLINRGRVVNRSKREQSEFKYNGPLLGTF